MNINTKQQKTEKKLYILLRLVIDMHGLYMFDYQ